MIMKEMFKQFRKIEKDLIKAGPKPVVSEARKKNSQGGVYGFLHKKNNTLDYIGSTKNLYERCMVTHQKPSSKKVEEMVIYHTGMSERDYSQKYNDSGYYSSKMYSKKAKEILAEYNFIVLEDENNKNRRSIIEGGLIRHYKRLGQAKFNKQDY